MRVLFVEDVVGTADAGEVKEVKNGFARNYLLPRKLAVAATPDHLQRIQKIQREAQDTRVKLSKDAKLVAEALDGRTITIEMKVGPTGRLFGSVTGRRIAEEVHQLTELSLDHRSILLGTAIHEPGDYDVTVRLYREVTSQVKLRVVPEGYVKEEAQRAEAGAARTAQPGEKPEAKAVPE
jgi:large subunit ribosomal protein L9